MAIIPIIMCGGSGVRLWPASRPSRPKQFIPLIGDRSSFQQTVLRMTGLPRARRPLVVAGVRHEAMLRDQLAAIGIGADLLLEPQARDSAAAMAAAAVWALRSDPDAILAVVASDHHIPDDAAFRAAVVVAAKAAAQGAIVTLGVRPTAPSTAYGYIKPAIGEGPVKPVSAFVEKPRQEIAVQYLADGYLWNSGNFIVRADRLLAELDAHAPGIRAAVQAAVEAMDGAGHLGADFAEAPKISIDYAVMEKTSHAAVLPVDFAWSDLGAWDAIWAASPKDGQGNAVVGDVLLQNATHCLARTDGPVVVAVGVQNLAIIAEKDAILVCALDAAQDVKAAVEALKAQGAPAADLAPPEDLAAASDRLSLWLRVQALPLWHSLGLGPSGFVEALSQEALPVLGHCRARVQPRQAYVYARAAALGWGGPGRAAAEAGLIAFEARYRRPDGLFRTLCDETGAVLDDSAMLYDQVFALLAWSATGQEAEALALLDRLRDRRAPAGGFREHGAAPYLSNPHMHLFEAAMAWVEAGQSSAWRDLAAEIAGLALTRFIDADNGMVREVFDADWRPASGEPGRRIEPGHQFEWAWLMARWNRLSGDSTTLAAADRLYRSGVAGIDRQRGVAVDALSDDLGVLEPSARLWPQTEWLKAALALDRPSDAALAVSAISAYLETPIPGLWRDKMAPDGRFIDEPAPASSLYHIALAIEDLAAYVARDRAF